MFKFPTRKLLLFALLMALAPGRAHAQDEGLTLYVRRSMGYGGGSQIQGTFRLEVDGPADLVSVTFKIDGQVIDTVDAPPFRLSFQTDSYPPGWHTLSAEAQTADGRQLVSNERRYEFLSAEQSQQLVGSFLTPVLVVVGLAMLASFAVPMLLSLRGKPAPLPLGAPRQYGLMGGAICPRCSRPFSMHIWALNLLLGRLDRCDHCGRWSLVRRASRDELARAEAAEMEMAPSTQRPPDAPESDLKRQLDDSRFMDDR